jgi:hypothetical protein
VKEEIRSKIEEKVKERDKVKFEIMREKRK